MSRDPDRRTNKFRFTKEICIGDIVQIIMVGGSIIWFAAHMDAQVSAFGRELDELHVKMATVVTDVAVLKANDAAFLKDKNGR